MKTFDWLEKWAHYSPNKLAIGELNSDKQINYLDLNHLALNYAAVLQSEFHLKKGDRIAVFDSFSIDLIALFGACQKTGICLVPINLRLTQNEIKHQINNSEASLLISSVEYESELKGIDCKKIKWQELKKTKSNQCTIQDIDENDPIFILYTSGSTGKPKGVIYTYKMLFWNSINTHLRLDLNSNDITVNCMPSYHTGGWNVLITPFLHCGAQIFLMDKFDPDEILRAIKKTKSTLFLAVPTMLKMMEESKEFQNVHLEQLRYFIVGGESLPIPVIEKWLQKGVPIRQGYGLSEVGPNVTSLHHEDALRKKGSIGFFNFYIEGKIVNEENSECKIDEKGELLLKGPCVTPGYWKNENATKDSFDGDWFKTGDIVVKDKEGFLYVVGRKKEMFISGGENVYPAEIEEVLRSHNLITDVAVVGIPDEKWGESGAALIVAKENSKIDENIILDFCSDKLAKFKIPRTYKFIEELPKNGTGKIDKQLITKLFIT